MSIPLLNKTEYKEAYERLHTLAFGKETFYQR